MIKSPNQVAFKLLRSNKYMIFSSILSIALAVMVLITMIGLISNGHQSMRSEIKKLYGDVDLMVGYAPDTDLTMSSSFIDSLTNHQGITQFSKVLITNTLIDDDAASAYTIGVEQDELSQSRYHFTQSMSNDDVIVNDIVAQSLAVGVNDTIEISGATFKIVEVLPSLSGTGSTPLMVILPLDIVKQIIYEQSGVINEATYLLVKKKSGFDELAIAEHMRTINEQLIIQITEEDGALKSNLQSLTVFIIVVAVLAVLVVAMIILANFEVYFYKNNYQFAIMRSIGASASKLFRIIWFQGMILSVGGGVLGCVAAALSYHYVQPYVATVLNTSLINESYPFHWLQAVLYTLLSIIIFQAVMLIPAYRCSRILPMKLMQANEGLDFKWSKARRIGGNVLVGISIFLIFCGAYLAPNAGTLLLAGLIALIALNMLLPLYFTEGMTSLLPFIKKVVGTTPYLAIKHLLPQVKRNTFVMLIVSTLMVIAIFGSSLLKSVNDNSVEYIRSQYATEITLTSRLGHETRLDPTQLSTRIQQLFGENIAATISNHVSVSVMEQDSNYSLDYSLVDFDQMKKLGLLPSNVVYYRDSIVLTKDAAKRLGVAVGSQFTVGEYDEQLQKSVPVMRVTVQSIVDKLPNYGDAYIDWNNGKLKAEYAKYAKTFIMGKADEVTISKLEQLKGYFPELKIGTLEQELALHNEQLLQRWAIFIVIIVVMLLSIMLGIYQTLMNNVRSKRKEIAVLRTVALRKSGVVGFVITQVITYLLSGIIFGTITGIVFTSIISLVDIGGLHIDFSLLYILPLVLLLGALFIFIPFAYRLGGKKLLLELNYDNR